MSERLVEVVKTKKLSSTVIAADGEEYRREDCRKIAGVFYKVGKRTVRDSGHGIVIRETFYRIAPHTTANKVDWDYSKGQYDLKSNMVQCVVGRDTIGYSTNVSNVVVDVNGNRLPLLNDQLLFEMNYVIDIGRQRAAWSFDKIDPKTQLRNLQSAIGVPLGHLRKIPYNVYPTDIYNMADYPPALRTLFTGKFEQHKLDRFFKGYTFGTEVETQAGHMPEGFLPIYGLVPLKDGSIAGHEYTSVVYDGRKPIIDLFDKMFTDLAKYTVADQKTSLHYHIGNVPRTKEFVVSLWTLYVRLQDELEKMMPPYKRNIHYLATKHGGPKDHCQRLFPVDKSDMDTMFNEILMFLSEGQQPKLIDKDRLIYKHPRADQPKWNWETRYMALNFLPLLFEPKGTVEFRLHSGTVNKYKAINWLFICLAMVKYADSEYEKILNGREKITLYDVIDSIYNDGTKEGKFLVTNGFISSEFIFDGKPS